MSAERPPRGAAPVGHVDDLDPIGAGAVLCLRLWQDGADTPALADFTATLGPHGGDAALAAVGRICTLCATYGRRPLMRHGSACPCLGGDEACFAQMMEAAGDGAREDAMMLAALMVRPDMAPALVALAEEAGLALRRLGAVLRHRGPAPAHLH